MTDSAVSASILRFLRASFASDPLNLFFWDYSTGGATASPNQIFCVFRVNSADSAAKSLIEQRVVPHQNYPPDTVPLGFGP